MTGQSGTHRRLLGDRLKHFSHAAQHAPPHAAAPPGHGPAHVILTPMAESAPATAPPTTILNKWRREVEAASARVSSSNRRLSMTSLQCACEHRGRTHGAGGR
ncbi:MAG: hypothetical protein ACRDJW_10275 [Thermomicrobiales bacterium]